MITTCQTGHGGSGSPVYCSVTSASGQIENYLAGTFSYGLDVIKGEDVEHADFELKTANHAVRVSNFTEQVARCAREHPVR